MAYERKVSECKNRVFNKTALAYFHNREYANAIFYLYIVVIFRNL